MIAVIGVILWTYALVGLGTACWAAIGAGMDNDKSFWDNLLYHANVVWRWPLVWLIVWKRLR